MLKFVKNKKTNTKNNCEKVADRAEVLSFLYPDTNSKVGTLCEVKIGNETRQKSGVSFLKDLPSDVSDKEYYITPNVLYPGAKRRVGAMCDRLNALYADLDLWHDQNRFQNKSVSDVLKELDETIFQKGLLPTPSIINDTGRGLLLIWSIREGNKASAHSKAIPTWKKLQKRIHEVLKDFCSDPACVTDTVRVFRLVGSRNKKSGTEVKTIYFNPNAVYDLKELLRTYTTFDIPSPKQLALLEKLKQEGLLIHEACFSSRHCARFCIKQNLKPSKKTTNYCKALANKAKVVVPDNIYESYDAAQTFISLHRKQTIRTNFNEQSLAKYVPLNKKRMYAIQEIIRNNPVQQGHRETLLFLYRLSDYHATGDKFGSLKRTYELNELFQTPSGAPDPLQKKELQRTIEKANLRYTYSNEKFLSLIRMSKTEWDCLSARSKDAKREADRRYYKKRLLETGKLLKKDEITKRRAKVKRLKASGYTLQEIATRLKVCLATVKNDWRALREKGVNNSDTNSMLIEQASKLTSLLTKEAKNKIDKQQETSWMESDEHREQPSNQETTRKVGTRDQSVHSSMLPKEDQGIRSKRKRKDRKESGGPTVGSAAGQGLSSTLRVYEKPFEFLLEQITTSYVTHVEAETSKDMLYMASCLSEKVKELGKTYSFFAGRANYEKIKDAEYVICLNANRLSLMDFSKLLYSCKTAHLLLCTAPEIEAHPQASKWLHHLVGHSFCLNKKADVIYRHTS